jgi:hypothetical protein
MDILFILKSNTMENIRYSLFLACPLLILLSCSTGSSKTKSADQTTSVDKQFPLEDTAKIKSDINDMVNSITSGQPDTNKLKAAASDLLSKDASILSDSGIDKLTGKDPSAKEAGDILKKFRDATGLTPAALDSIKKVAASLGQ